MHAAQEHPTNSTTGRKQLEPRWVRSGLRAFDFVAPTLASKLARRLYFKPGRLPLKPEQQSILAEGDRFELDVSGLSVVGHQWGHGPRTAWLVHGWGGHLGQLTPMVKPLLARGFRVLGFDWPGHGESAGDISSLLHALRALKHLERFVGPPTAVVAHSFGAAATVLALGHGLSCERVVFLAPVARLSPFFERFTSALGMGEPQRQRFLTQTEAWLEAPLSDFEPQRFTPKLQVPMLVLHSRDDREVALSEGELMTSTWGANAQLEIQEKLGHRRLLGDPDCVAQMVRFVGA